MRDFQDDGKNTCKHCGGPIAIRNPTGTCDHLYWPDMLTDEAKRANGFRKVTRTTWTKEPQEDDQVTF